jgi:uncharacterized protein
MDQEFLSMTEDILSHPLFIKMKGIPHHGGENSLYDHSLDTALCAYHMAQALHLSPERTASVTRTALLHDFFGYDWHSDVYHRYVRGYTGLDRVKHMHAFLHGPVAARRAERVFHVDQRQCQAIRSHMFPLAPVPSNTEGWVVTVADKVVASREMGEAVGWYMRRLFHRGRAAVHN